MAEFHRRQVRCDQDVDPADILPAGDRTRRAREAEARRPRGRQQGLIPRPRRAPRRVRLQGQGHGGTDTKTFDLLTLTLYN